MIESTYIPKGKKCFEIIDVNENEIYLCPYWYRHPFKNDQSNGYCSLLGLGDWEDDNGHGLLWDAIKECNINME